ncbi:MAG TPA: hypothetical protein VF245_00435 [Solirubrobacterales bacterium]
MNSTPALSDAVQPRGHLRKPFVGFKRLQVSHDRQSLYADRSPSARDQQIGSRLGARQ